MNLLQKTIFGKLYATHGYQFAYSTVKLFDSSIYAAEIENSLSQTLNVGFVGNSLNTSAITSFANSNNAYYKSLYDQANKLGNINSKSDVLRPYATNTSFQGIDYVRDSAQESGFVRQDDIDFNTGNDWIVDYVFRNETLNGNQRTNFIIASDMLGRETMISCCINPSGASYIIGIKYLSSNRNSQMSDVAYGIARNSNYFLFTYAYIGGVFRFYYNGIEVTSTTTNFNVGGINLKGIYIGVGYSSGSLQYGKINDFKTLSLFTGQDLSGYNIIGHINNLKTKHSII